MVWLVTSGEKGATHFCDRPEKFWFAKMAARNNGYVYGTFLEHKWSNISGSCEKFSKDF